MKQFECNEVWEGGTAWKSFLERHLSWDMNWNSQPCKDKDPLRQRENKFQSLWSMGKLGLFKKQKQYIRSIIKRKLVGKEIEMEGKACVLQNIISIFTNYSLYSSALTASLNIFTQPQLFLCCVRRIRVVSFPLIIHNPYLHWMFQLGTSSVYHDHNT